MKNQTTYARHMKQGLEYALDAVASVGSQREDCLRLAQASLSSAGRAMQEGNVQEQSLMADVTNAVNTLQHNTFVRGA